MPVNIIVFGQLADITGSSLSLDNVADTDSLMQELNKLYPALAEKKYAVAVDKQVVNKNISLTSDNTVAILPPFSGG
jgi:molybdopterin converting factor small subunit